MLDKYIDTAFMSGCYICSQSQESDNLALRLEAGENSELG